jgi:acyl carrier protein
LRGEPWSPAIATTANGATQNRRPIRVDDAQIYARLKGIFEDVFDDDSIEMTPQLSAKDVDGWDSLTHIRLILTIERAFKTKFSTSEIGKLKSVGDLVTLIKTRG